MSTVAYKVEPAGGEWALKCEGRMRMTYAPRSAAYEVAVAEAEGDLREGRDVVIEVLCGEHVVLGSDSARARPVKCGAKVLTLGYPRAVVRFDPLFSFDLSEAARHALDVLGDHFESRAVGITLKPGDLLIIDNMSAVHARSAFTPRYDGAERWLQRVSVISRELPATIFDPSSSLLVCT